MEVGLHTKLKHLILSYYFSAGWRKVFQSGNIYSLYYVDLFSGDGVCICNDLDEEIEKYFPEDMSKREWSPSFFRLMDFADESNFNLKCFFNDIDKKKIDSLSKRVSEKGYSDFIEERYWRDANVVCEDILDKIGKPNRPSLFYLDPTNHNQLNFSTIEKIARFKDEKTGRRPELIINFMLHSIFMAIKRRLPENDVISINNFLGTNFSRQELLDIVNDKSKKTYETFLNIFIEKLENFGYFCNYQLVKSTKTHSPIYYLIFATNNKIVFKWYRNINSYVKTLKEEWIKKNFIIKTMSDEKKKGQTFLGDY